MSFYRLSTMMLIGWYLVLAVVHYLSARPLWLDEQWVFANINGRSLSLLFSASLLHDQAFPRLYLASINLLADAWHYHVLALRLLPFMAMLAAFACWVYIAGRVLSKRAFLLFLLCWTASGPLIYYAAELKQYSMDVLVAGLFMWYCCYQDELKQRLSAFMFAVLIGGLAFSCSLSYAAFFFMLLPLYNLIVAAREGKLSLAWPLFYAFCAFAACGIVYQIDLRHADSSRMVTYWGEYMISCESPLEFIRTLQEGCNNLIARWFALKPRWIRMGARVFIGVGFIYMLCKAWGMFKRDGCRFKSIETVSVAALLLCMVLSAFKKFPFVVPRMYLFMAPVLFFMTAEAFDWIKARNTMMYRVLLICFIVFLVIVGMGVTQDVLQGRLSAEPELWR